MRARPRLCLTPARPACAPAPAAAAKGIQVLADDLTGFGGVSRHLLDELRDELPGVKMLYFSLRTPEPAEGGEAGGGGSGAVR
jgi:hypothetical protein